MKFLPCITFDKLFHCQTLVLYSKTSRYMLTSSPMLQLIVLTTPGMGAVTKCATFTYKHHHTCVIHMSLFVQP